MMRKEKYFSKAIHTQLRPVTLALALCILAAASFAAVTAARYVGSWTADTALAEPGSFYFSSDMLKEGGASYTIYDWSSGISFHLNNFEDAQRVSEIDITYDVTVTGGTITAGSSSGEIKKDVAFSDTLTITPSAGENEVTASVVTAPYAKTLSATFHLVSSDAPSYRLVDSAGSPTAELIIKGGISAETITVTWNPEKVSPDNTNPLMNGIIAASNSISLKARESCTILFFKSDPTADYSRAETNIANNSITVGN